MTVEASRVRDRIARELNQATHEEAGSLAPSVPQIAGDLRGGPGQNRTVDTLIFRDKVGLSRGFTSVWNR